MAVTQNIPKLRFPGFEREWEEIQLGKLAQKIGDGLHGTPKYSEDSDINFINGNNLTNGKIEITEKTKKVDHTIFAKNDKGLNENTILISLNGTIGNIAKYNHEKVMLGKSVGYFNFKENTNFYFHVFHTDKIQNFFISELTGSTIKNLSLKTLRETIFPFPSIPEQQKIASFLSAVDEKIQQLSHKKELLEQYKKGLMQQLFSGKLRFKDENGKDYADWEEKTFGDIYSFYTTNSLSREKLNYDSGAVKNIHYGDIHTKFKTLFDVNEEVVPFVNSDFDISKIKSECYCQEGDLVIADASEDYADIGKSIEIINLQNEKIVAGLHTFLARPNKTKMYVGFSGYKVRSENFRKQIMIIAQGSKVLSISTGRLAMIKMKIPVIEEQQKIAAFLSSIDTKIESTSQQINQMQSFKKGLLQQLFV